MIDAQQKININQQTSTDPSLFSLSRSSNPLPHQLPIPVLVLLQLRPSWSTRRLTEDHRPGERLEADVRVPMASHKHMIYIYIYIAYIGIRGRWPGGWDLNQTHDWRIYIYKASEVLDLGDGPVKVWISEREIPILGTRTTLSFSQAVTDSPETPVNGQNGRLYLVLTELQV